MAYSSNSSSRQGFKYDVFLSFRGEDTRKNFVDHLYYALQQKGVHTYKDDERIEKGRRIDDELIKSIQDSRFFIIILSKNYASSSWCLDELVKIMECHKMTVHTAYPVFYDVEPSEVRKQSGQVKEAFAKHKTKEAVGKWRDALIEAADIAGWELKNIADGHESKFIQKIVEEISLQLRSFITSVDRKLIGMATRVKDVVTSLETNFGDACMIGIKGIGGGGKTTLARAVFDQISIEFEGKSFLENVREVSNASLSNMRLLQKQLLSDVLNDEGINVKSVYDGKSMIKKMMCDRKVLIVLDDVDHVEQLEALAGEPNWFKLGSRIIITTRDEQVLVAHGVNLIRDVNLLSHEEAICLFSRYAYGRENPVDEYEELSRKVVHYANGLPLTIKVLGSFLRGKNELDWKDALERLKKIPLQETMKILELSYDGLEDDYKEIFLDVACILKGWSKESAIEVLESCGFHARNGLRVLVQKSLITISDDGYLGMHDHIEEVGRNIVRRSHPDEPNKHSRLWNNDETVDILTRDLGSEATRCIKMSPMEHELGAVMRGLKNMRNLRFLETFYGFYRNVDEDSLRFPNSLRFFSWLGYPFKSLHETFGEDFLVGLHLVASNIVQLWKGTEIKVLNKLRFLDLGSSNLRTFDLGLTPNLETLHLNQCHSLVDLKIPNGCQKLVSLNLSYSKLRTLDLGQSLNLERLSVERCDDFVELHMPAECLKLIYLNLSYSWLRNLNLGATPKLVSIDLSHSKLRTLNLGPIPKLETLNLDGCHDLVELHMPLGCPKLISLYLYSSKLRTLDLGLTQGLETLSLAGCSGLEELHIPSGCPNLKSLDLHCSKLRTLVLGLTPNLERIDLKDCYDLVEIRAPVGCLKKVVHMDLSGCRRFRSFQFEKWFQSTEICSLSELELHFITESTDICPLHSDDNLPKFQFTCFYREHPTSLFGNCICKFKYLKYLKLKACWHLEKLIDDIVQLECLEELILISKRIKHLPDSICMLKNLKSLELRSLWLIEKLPEDLGRLESLEKLILTECMFLREIPNSICEMKRLKYLHLLDCSQVEKLPDDLGRIKCLEELNIEGSGMTLLPKSILLLKGLRLIAPKWFFETCSFTSEMQTSEYEMFCNI